MVDFCLKGAVDYAVRPAGPRVAVFNKFGTRLCPARGNSGVKCW